MSVNYITAEQFLKQPKKVQEIFIDWWNPQIGDLFCDINAYDINHPTCISHDDKIEIVKTDKKYNYYVPLLQIHQLIQFIEDKTNCKIQITLCEDGYYIELYILNASNYYELNECYDICKKEILQALWQVACKIASKN